MLLKKICSREFLSYGFFGVLTTLLNLALYHVLVVGGLDYVIANLITLIVVKLTAYVVNKIFVFRSKSSNLLALCKEFCMFVITRGLTGLIDFFGLILAVEIFGFDKIISKYVLQVVVIILNYIFGKVLVFIKR